jgi:hypothetical protein
MVVLYPSDSLVGLADGRELQNAGGIHQTDVGMDVARGVERSFAVELECHFDIPRVT